MCSDIYVETDCLLIIVICCQSRNIIVVGFGFEDLTLVAWDASLPFYGAKADGVDESTITDNYTGNSGSIYNQAVALGGWDFETVWTTDPTPLLR